MYAFEKELGELNGQSAERTGLKRTAIEYNKGGKLVDVYDYKDEQGEVVYQVRRYEDKKFAVFTRKDGEWIPGLEEALRVPYHLPELSKANKIYICEGEKDADNVAELIVMSMGYASWYRLKSWWRIHESGVRSPRGVGLRFNRFLYT